MRNKLLFLFLAFFFGFGLAQAAPPLVGGETAGTTAAPAPPTITTSMAGGVLTINLVGVVGTDDKASLITPTPVPDGSVVCMKANGFHQSADWRGGHVLGKIVTSSPEACSWGRGVVRNGMVVMTVPKDKVCPAGRTEAAGIMSGVVQLPDGKQAWIPHSAQYRVYNANGKDATGIGFNCQTGQVMPLPHDQAKAMERLF